MEIVIGNSSFRTHVTYGKNADGTYTVALPEKRAVEENICGISKKFTSRSTAFYILESAVSPCDLLMYVGLQYKKDSTVFDGSFIDEHTAGKPIDELGGKLHVLINLDIPCVQQQ